MIAAIKYNVCLNRNGYEDKEGRRQVVVELYQRGTRRVLNTFIHVRAADFACGRVQPSHPDHDLMNRRVRRIVRSLMELEDEYRREVLKILRNLSFKVGFVSEGLLELSRQIALFDSYYSRL